MSIGYRVDDLEYRSRRPGNAIPGRDGTVAMAAAAPHNNFVTVTRPGNRGTATGERLPLEPGARPSPPLLTYGFRLLA